MGLELAVDRAQLLLGRGPGLKVRRQTLDRCEKHAQAVGQRLRRQAARALGQGAQPGRPRDEVAPCVELTFGLFDRFGLILDPPRESHLGRFAAKPVADLVQPVDPAGSFEGFPLFVAVTAGEALLRRLPEKMREGQVGGDILDLRSPFGLLQQLDDDLRLRLLLRSTRDGGVVVKSEADAMTARLGAAAGQIRTLGGRLHEALEPSNLARQAPLERIEEAALAKAVGADEQR